MRISKIIFLVTIVVLPFSFAINPVSGIDLSLIRVIIPILFLIWIGESFFYKKIFIDTRPRFLFLILFLTLIFLSIFWATEQQRAWRKILFIFSIFPVYLVAFDLFKKNLSKNAFLKIILATSLVQAILGIFQFLLQFIVGISTSLNLWQVNSRFFLGKNFAETVHQYSSWLVNINGETILRAFGTFPDPHLFSLFIALSIPVSWYFFKKTKNKIYLIIALFQLIAIMLSFSRSSYLAVLIFLIILGITELSQAIKQKKNIWIYLFGLFLILAIIITPNPVSKRFNSSFNLNEGSNQGRLEMWGKSIDLIKKHPWNGVGIGNFSYHIKPSSSFREPIYAHNLFLDFGSEIGILSIILLLLIFVAVFSHSSLHKKNNASNLNNIIISFFIILFIFSLFETPFYSIRIFPLILIFLAIPNEKS